MALITPEEKEVISMGGSGGRFPKYQLEVNGVLQFFSLGDAGWLYNSGHDRVKFGTLVLIKNYETRPMTEEDRAKIAEVARVISASK